MTNDEPFEIQFRWKEEVIYWEGDRGFVFDSGWGRDPIETYVPDDEYWDRVMPDWLVGRRDVVVARLVASPSHVVRADPGLNTPMLDRTITR
jgi:hypothetical protein